MRHLYGFEPCELCDLRALVEVDGQKLCSRHAFGLPARERAKLEVHRAREERLLTERTGER